MPAAAGCPPGGTSAAVGTTASVTTTPPHAALLRDFANTVDQEDGTDTLTDPAALSGWLRARGLPGSDAAADDADLTAALRLRAGLRSLLADHHDRPPRPTADGRHDLDALARELPLRLSFDAEYPRLVPGGRGASAALGSLLVAVAAAAADGSWGRLKVCPAETCQWVFYDGSRNRSRTWCAMGVCGNRHKTRAYRARRRSARPPG